MTPFRVHYEARLPPEFVQAERFHADVDAKSADEARSKLKAKFDLLHKGCRLHFVKTKIRRTS